MKKIFGYLAAFAMTAAMIGCSSDDAEYTPAEPIDGAYIYFSSEAATTYSLNADDTSIEFDVFRNDAEGMLDVPVAIEFADDDYASLFTADNAVIFEDGVKAATWKLSFDREAMTEGSEYVLTVTFDDPTLTTPYAASSLTLTLKVPEPWDSLGDATYIDAWTFDEEYKGELFRHRNDPNRFMLRVPYDTAVEEEGYYEYDGTGAEYITFRLLQPGSSLNGISITEEGLVYFEPFSTGAIDDTYGVAWEMNHPVQFTTFQSESAWVYSRVLSYQDAEKTLPAIVQFAPLIYMDGIGYYNYSTYNGVIQIVFPGVVLADYAVEITYTGHLTDPKNNHFAVAEVTGGEDVEYIEVALGAGDDPNAVLAAYLEGELEPVRIEGNSGQAQFAVEEDGTYTIIAVSYGNDEPQEVSYTTFKFYIGATPELSPLEKTYTEEEFIAPVSSNDLVNTTWNLYARDYFGDTTDRVKMGEATFTILEELDDNDTLIGVSGLDLGYFGEGYQTTWEIYEGILYSLAEENLYAYGPYTLGMLTYASATDMLYYQDDLDFIGAFVDEGYIAMIPYPGYDTNGIVIGLFDESGEYSGQVAEVYYDIMFEDQDAAAASTAVKAAKTAKAISSKEFKSLSASIATRSNYVETRRGHIQSKIDEHLAKKVAKHADKSSFEILNKGSKSARNLHANKQIVAGAVVR